MSKSSNSPIKTAFFAIDRTGKVVYKSPGLKNLLPRTPALATLEELRQTIEPAHQPEFDNLVRQTTPATVGIIATQQDVTLRLNLLRIEKQKTFYFLEAIPSRSIRGPVIDKLTENAYGIITFLDSEGERLYVSPSVERTFGIDKDYLLGRNIFEDVHPGDLPQARRLFREIIANPEWTVRGVRLRFRHPRHGWILMEGSLLNLLHIPEIKAVVVNSRSIQNLQNLQDSIREYQFKLEGMLENTEALVYMKDLEGHYLIGNHAYAKALGGGKSKFLGKTDRQIFGADLARTLSKNDRLVYATQKPQKFSETIVFPQQNLPRSFVTNKFPLFDAQRSLVGLCGIAHEVTQEKKYLRQIEQSSAYFRAIVENSFDYVVVLDRFGNKKSVTPSVRSVIGFGVKEYLKLSFFANIHPEDEAKVKALWAELLLRFKTRRLDVRVKNKNNRWVWVGYVFNNLLTNPHLKGVVIHVLNIHRTKTAQLEVLESKLLFEDFMCNSPNPKAMFDANEKILATNAKFKRRFCNSPSLLNQIVVSNPRVIATGQSESFRLERKLKRKTETYEINKFPLKNHAGRVYGVGVIALDITKRVKSQLLIEKLAYYDELTGLPNKHSLWQVLKRKIQTRISFALVSIDLYKFRIANDSLGPKNGDKLIVRLGKIIAENLRPSDFLARLSGDEFIILTSTAEPSEVRRLMTSIMDQARQSFSLAGVRLSLQPTAGVVFSNSDYKEPADYIRAANIAAERAKKNGVYSVEYFTARMQTQLHTRLVMRNDVLQAFELNEFELFYQPIHVLNHPKKIYFEALIRWNHAVHGRLTPESFFDYIDEPTLKSRLDEWVLERAVAQVKELAVKFPQTAVSVNVSAAQFSRPGFFEFVKTLLEKNALPPRYLYLEITEEAVLQINQKATENLTLLRALGVKILLDDFGTGYSSLSYLSRLPLDMLKIDRSFIATMHTDSRNYRLVTMIIEIAKTLGLEVVAEGVETQAQLEAFESLTHSAVQGFYFSRPLPFAKVATYLANSL